MSTVPDRRTRKRLATRQAISDAATRLFMEHGFDGVTIDQIAQAADVGRMTVFNHFPRKEDMFFDLDEQGRSDLAHAIEHRGRDIAPIEALRLFAHEAVASRKPYVHFGPDSERFIATVNASEALKARARSIRDELTKETSHALALCVGREPDDLDAHLAASIQVATWSVALLAAHRAYLASGEAKDAERVLLALIDKGASGLQATMAGTPYATA